MPLYLGIIGLDIINLLPAFILLLLLCLGLKYNITLLSRF